VQHPSLEYVVLVELDLVRNDQIQPSFINAKRDNSIMDDFEKEYPGFDWKNTHTNIQEEEIVLVQNTNTFESRSILQSKLM